MRTISFVQIINDKRYTVSIPENRVDSIIGRVDLWIERGKFSKALEVITPFIGTQEAIPVEVKLRPKNQIQALIMEHRNKGKYAVMRILQDELGLNKQQAYYQTRKAGL